jgi:hypothetical protein
LQLINSLFKLFFELLTFIIAADLISLFMLLVLKQFALVNISKNPNLAESGTFSRIRSFAAF